MSKFYSTRQVASLFNVQPDRIQKAIWCGRLDSPKKSPAGHYLWILADIEQASWVLLRKPFDKRRLADAD